MDMFEKATRAAKNLGASIYSTTKEQSELASLNVQKSVVEKKLNESYAEIGKRYVEYIDRCESEVAFNVDDIIEKMQPDLEKLTDIKLQIAEKEGQIKQNNEEKAQKKAQDDFEFEKSKLDKALAMDIITQEEYSKKIAAAKIKLENYDMLRKIELQLEMGIITRDEYNEKINAILN